MSGITILRSASAPGDKAPPTVTGGSGVRLFLRDGRTVLDGSNTAALLGHAHPAIVEAMRRAAAYPVVSDMWGWREREEAAQELVDVAFRGEGWVGGIRFFLSGGEANDQALSLAQVLTGRGALVARQGAYHGGVGLARDVTLEPQWHGGLASTTGGSRPVPRTTRVKALPLSPCATALDRMVCEQCTCGDDTAEAAREAAAVIVDTTQGGAYPSGTYLGHVAAACRDARSMWIADEVVTGLGRTGRWFGFQRGRARPDMVTLGKGLTGGAAPGAAVVVSHDVMAQLANERWQSYGTMRGYPGALAALRATVRTIASEGLVARAAALHGAFERSLTALADEHPSVASVVGEGAHWTIRLQGEGDRAGEAWTGDGGALPLSARVSGWALDAGVLIGTSSEPNMVFIAPPLIVEDDDVERIVVALDHALTRADRTVDPEVAEAL